MMGKIALVLITISLLYSCMDSKDECKNDELAILDLNVSIGNKYGKQSFETGDQIGLYLVNYVGDSPGLLGDIFNTVRLNVNYMYSSLTWHAKDAEEIYVNSTLSDVYAYYPYDPEMSAVGGKLNLAAYPFRVQPEQQQSLYESDFLWAKSSRLSNTSSKADIIFSHLLSRCEVSIKFTEGEVPADAQFKIYNTQTLCAINLRDGVAEPTGEIRGITPHRRPVANAGYDYTYDAIIVPQLIERGTPLFTVTHSGATLVYEAVDDIDFLPQKIRAFNLIVSTADLR